MKAVLVFISCLLAAPLVSAQGSPTKESKLGPRAALKEACAEDLKTLCADAKPGPRAQMKCLRRKKDQVSEACKTQMEQTKKEITKRMKKRKK